MRPVRAKALIIQKINNKKSNKMKLNIAVLAGDGIGPEIMKQGVAVMQAIAEKFNHEFTYNEAICGAHVQFAYLDTGSSTLSKVKRQCK